MKKFFLVLIIFLNYTSQLKADGIGIGASGMYNLQTESFGAGFRINIKPSNMFRIVPQVNYYPSFNKIHEYYVGLSIELNIFKIQNYDFYLLAHGAYNGWLNAESSLMKEAKYGNIAIEAGGGIVRNKGCLRPFTEYRYNGNWKETNFRIGIMFVFGCNKKGYRGSANKRKKRSAITCPAYN